nr:hypothetical protein [Tanacetum cinerariifolium]
MLSNQKPSDEKLDLGFNSFEASSNETKEIKFVTAQKKASSDGGPINMGGPQNVQAAPKEIMGPPPVGTPGSEKSVSFQKSILGPRPKHIIVNKVKVSLASDNKVKQFYKPLSKPRVGFLKPNFRSKTPPPRRVNNNYPRAKIPQPKRNIGRQNQPHGFLICLGVDLEPDEWIKDSGCSKHMTGNQKLFSTYNAYNGDNVEHVDNLGFKLLSIRQICDNNYRVTFSEHDSEITKDGKIIGLFLPSKIDLSYSGLEEFKQTEFESYGPTFCDIESKNASKNIPNKLKESLDAPLIEFVRAKQQEKPVRKPVKYAEMYRSQGPRGNQRNWNNLKSQQLGINTARPRPVNTARPRPVNTARPNSTVVNAVRVNQILRNLIEDMLPLGEEQIVAELLVKQSSMDEIVAYFVGSLETDTVRTVDNGEQEITAIVDGKKFTVTEASVRRHLQLADADGISVLPNTEIFDQLSLMGYVISDDKLTFQKDDAIYEEWDDRVERATTTAASLDVAQASGDSPRCQESIGGSITHTRSERVPTQSDDSPLLRVNTLRSDEGSMSLQEFTVSTQREAHGQEDQPEDQLGVFSAAKVLVDAAKVHTYSRRRRTVSTGSGGISTASRLFSIAKEPVSTTGISQEVNIATVKDKGKGIMTESEPVQTKTKWHQEQERLGLKAAAKLQEQFDKEERQRISRVHEVAQTFTEEE